VSPTETIGIDELARRCATTVRTIREYQTLGLLPPPGKTGRVATYDGDHVARLDTIARLQARGYSLAAIRDLLAAWQAGASLPTVLGIAGGAVGALDEMPVVVDAGELDRELPAVFGSKKAARTAEAAGLASPTRDGRRVVRSPALVQLVAETVGAGLAVDDALALVRAINDACEQIAEAAVAALVRDAGAAPPPDPEATLAMLRRARGLLAQGVATMAISHIGDHLNEAAAGGRVDVAEIVDRLRIGAVRDTSS
jgi:DNA-binding transcriptional MerR regulator